MESYFMETRQLSLCSFRKIVGITALTLALSVLAPDSAQAEQALGQAANDPTASLMSLQIQDSYSGSFHQLSNENANMVILRPVVPFKIGDIKNIARATVPIITDSPSGKTGLGDSVLFDLMVKDTPWGRWGAGPVMLVPTASHDMSWAQHRPGSALVS